MTHHPCHAIDCDRSPPGLMCKRHWLMVPPDLQTGVWGHYRKGQEIDKKPSEAYLRSQIAAVNSVAAQEGREGYDMEKRIEFLRKNGYFG